MVGVHLLCWCFPGRTLKQSTNLGLSRSLGVRYVEMFRKGFLSPWAVDGLAVVVGRVASGPTIFAVLWREGCRNNLQFEARGRRTSVEFDARSQEWLHVVRDGWNDDAVRQFV